MYQLFNFPHIVHDMTGWLNVHAHCMCQSFLHLYLMLAIKQNVLHYMVFLFASYLIDVLEKQRYRNPDLNAIDQRGLIHTYDRNQRTLLTDLNHQCCSAPGRDPFQRTLLTDLNQCCSAPRRDPFQRTLLTDLNQCCSAPGRDPFQRTLLTALNQCCSAPGRDPFRTSCICFASEN